MYLKNRVTLRIYFHLVLWMKVGPPIWPTRSHMRNTFDGGVIDKYRIKSAHLWVEDSCAI